MKFAFALMAAALLACGAFAADSGAVTEGTQTFAGDKTFSGNVTIVGSLTTSGTLNPANMIQAGSNGNAGTIKVYPGTPTKGYTSITAADNTGNTTTSIVTAAQANTRTYTIPDAGASSNFLMTNSSGTQTIASGNVLLTAGTLTLTSGNEVITSGNLTLTSGNALLTSGSLILSSGNEVLTSGNLTLTSGNALLTSGSLVLSGGNIAVTGAETVSGAIQSGLAAGGAGSFVLYPTTTARGKTTLGMADNSGDTTTAIAIAAQTGARTLTIPDGGQATASFVLTEGAQTVNGAKTFGSIVTAPAAGVKIKNTTHDAIVVCADQAAADHTYTIPDAAGNASFVLTAAAQTIGGAKTFTSAPVINAGATATVATAMLIGTATEGMRIRVLDQIVTCSAIENAMTATIPKGAIILSVQANVETALTGGSTTTTFSLGTTGAVDTYGSSGFPTIGNVLTHNAKSNWLGSGMTRLAADTIIKVIGTVNGGASAGDTALTAGTVRVLVTYMDWAALASD